MATNKAASNTKKAPAKQTARPAKTTTTVKAAPAKSSGLAEHVSQSLRSYSLWRALAAELIGTFLLASVFVTGQGQPIFLLFGLAGIVLIIGGISGAHVNPAVTIGAWVTRRIGWLRALGYIIAQVLGAALAFVTLSTFIGGTAPVSEEAALYGQSAPTLYAAAAYAVYEGKEWFVLFAELLGATILAFAFAHSRGFGKDQPTAGALTYGVGVFIALMVAVTAAGYVSATAVFNPAVAVTLYAYDWSQLWTFAIYAIAPAIGAVVGFILHDLLMPRTR